MDTRLTIEIDEELKRDIKATAAKLGLSIRDFITEAAREKIQKEK